jgi:hypothetical protein
MDPVTAFVTAGNKQGQADQPGKSDPKTSF